MVTRPFRRMKAPMPVMMRMRVRTVAETIVMNDGGRERVKGESEQQMESFLPA
jgi:hypothetical protein